MTLGPLMTLASIGVLIFFTHHVPRSVHVLHPTAGVGRELLKSVDKRFPNASEWA